MKAYLVIIFTLALAGCAGDCGYNETLARVQGNENIIAQCAYYKACGYPIPECNSNANLDLIFN